MEGADWWAIGISGASFAISVLTLWLNRRWRNAARLLELHESLRRLKTASLKHLEVQVGEYPTESDVTDLREQAAIRLRGAPDEIGKAAARLFEQCEAVMAGRVREAPIERTDEIRRRIQEAFDAADAVIGGRWERRDD